MKRNHAFTLAELLLSLSLAGILAGILWGAVHSAKTAHATTQCLMKLRTIGRAMGDYSVDNDGYLPPHFTYPFYEGSSSERLRKTRWSWITYLARHLNSPDYSGPIDPVFECPADKKAKSWPKPRYYLPADDRSHLLVSYGYNYLPLSTSASHVKNTGVIPKRTYVIGNPARLILVSEGPTDGGDPANPTDPIVSTYTAEKRPHLRHQKRFNAVFLDGHAESLDAAATLSRKGYWDPE